MPESARPFEPPRWLRGPHRQTLWANYAPRELTPPPNVAQAESLTLPTADGDRLRVHWWRLGDSAPTLVILHGLTGCANAPQVMGLAIKAARRGFEVVRVDLRNASTTACSSIGVGHAGRSEDAVTVLDHVAARKRGGAIAIAGYSLGGNVILKAAGEWGRDAPAAVVAAAVASVPIDLDLSCRSIDGPGNGLYRRYFLRRLTRTVERRRQRHPGFYPDVDLRSLRSLRAFDGAIVAPVCGFVDAADYYRRSSSLAVVDRIRVPTLLIQAQDDPFVPFAPFRDRRIVDNMAIRMLSPAHGGHVGFLAARRGGDPDRFWAENRILEHCARHASLD